MPDYTELISGYSRPILILHSAKRVRDYRQSHYGCRQNKLRVLWNALLTTPYVSEHDKYMFLVARDLYEMLILYRGKHTSRRSTVGIWSEVRVYRAPIHEYTVGQRSAVGQVSRQPEIEVLNTAIFITTGVYNVQQQGLYMHYNA